MGGNKVRGEAIQQSTLLNAHTGTQVISLKMCFGLKNNELCNGAPVLDSISDLRLEPSVGIPLGVCIFFVEVGW